MTMTKGAAKAYQEACRLKEQLATSCKDPLNDSEAWQFQYQLQRLYQQVLILDLEYALDKKVEQDLWNHGFKNFIGTLQSISKDKKNPNCHDAQDLLSWCLNAASGFYFTLLNEICSAFDLDLPMRRKDKLLKVKKKLEIETQPQKISCNYICQYCLVHLGDIARYRNQAKQAEQFYRHAVSLSPSSGQPYNQLAILDASRGDKLGTIYNYVRAVMVRHPFPVAATNLGRMLAKHADDLLNLDTYAKLSAHEYVNAFLKLHGLLHVGSSLESAEKLSQILMTSLTAHIAMESITCWKLVQMMAINIYTLYNVGGELDVLSDELLTPDELKIKLIVIDFLAASLSAFLLPVYTIKCGEPLLDYFALPAVKLLLDWIQQEPSVLGTLPFKTRLQIWPSLCKLLNDLQPLLDNFSSNKYSQVPLPEDRDLQGFLPFEKSFQNVNFHNDSSKQDQNEIKKLRAQRCLEFGIWLSKQNPDILSIQNLSKSILFEPIGRPEPPSGDLIREFEELSLTKPPSLSPSDGSEPLTGASTPDLILMNLKPKYEGFNSENVTDKQTGILKTPSQNEKKDSITEKACVQKPHRGNRNVALQAILNKSNEEAKQVKFKTPSPNLDVTKNQTSPNRKKQKIQNKQDNKLEPKNKPTKELNQQQQQQSKNKNEIQKVDNTLLQQQKLMEVLSPKEKKPEVNLPEFKETINSFPPLPGTSQTIKTPIWNKEVEELKIKKEVKKNLVETQQKQQLLSDLFSKKGLDELQKQQEQQQQQEQPQNLSGLLNLSKQQQQMLTDSKTRALSTNDFPVLQVQPKQPRVDKVEMARKEYEAAIVALQEQERQRMFTGGERVMGEDQYAYERRMIAQQQPQPPVLQQPPLHQPPPPIYVRVNQPVVSLPQYRYKIPTQMFVPWQEPEQPPMPPTWWSEEQTVRHQKHQQQQQQITENIQPIENMYSQQHANSAIQLTMNANTYSLFSTPTWNTLRPSNETTEPQSYNNVPGGLIGHHQSFWSGPGPSPLERLLEQQKQMKEGPSPKGGT